MTVKAEVARPAVAVAAKKDNGLNVVVEKTQYFLPFAEIAFEDLTPDPRNPRYRYLTETNGDLSPDAMFDLLKNEEATINLATSIERAGGLSEPVIVEVVGEQNIVREGNRRWAAYRLLREKDQLHWKYMPCHLMPPEMSGKLIAVYIGIMHRQGKVEWDGHARAGYIHELRYTHKMANEDIAAAIGISKQEVERSLVAYQHSTALAKRTGTPPSYSKVYECLSKMGKDANKILRDETTREAVYEGLAKAPSHRASRLIPKIITSKKAMEVLAAGEGEQAFDDAIAVIKEQNPAAVGVFREMLASVKHLDMGYAEALAHLQKKRGNKQHIDIFSRLVEIVVRLAKDAGRTDVLNEAMSRAKAAKGKRITLPVATRTGKPVKAVAVEG